AIERIVHIWRITLHQPVTTSKLVGRPGGVEQASTRVPARATLTMHESTQTEASNGLEPAPIPLTNASNREDGSYRAEGEKQDIDSSASNRHSPIEMGTDDSREAPVRSTHTSGPPFNGGVRQE